MVTSGSVREIRPQPGLQVKVLSSPADIVIAGGAAGSGKTHSLLIEPTRHINNPDFGAVIFRRETPQITNEGGLWDESEKMYGAMGATPNRNELSWTFKRGSKVRFSHMQHATDRFNWDGSQIPLIGFDQLESFEEIQFWYMFSRNRSTCGVLPYLRATCNPVPEDDPTGGWLNRLISWWIDPSTGYPIKARSGIIRWFVRINEELHWGDTRHELVAQFPGKAAEDVLPKSFTFIPGTLADNPILTQHSPQYRADLLAMPLVERERLLAGNWHIKPTAGKVFNRTWFNVTSGSAIPNDVTKWVRYWDKAGTEGAGKYTAGALVGIRGNKRAVIADMVRGQWSALNRENMILQTAHADRNRGLIVDIWVEQEPGSGGKESAESTIRNLHGFMIHAERVTGDKVTRAGPLAAQAEAGNVDVISAPWTEAFLSEAQNFDGVHGFSDQIDAASGAYNKATGGRTMQVVQVR